MTAPDVAAASPTVTVREARADEAAAVDALVDSAYAHDYGVEDHHDDPDRSAAHRARSFVVWVAVDENDALLGSVTTRRAGGPALHEDALPDELDLRLLAVSPRHRRKGIGATLIEHVIDDARDHGYAAVLLKTALHMTGPQRMYPAIGFTRVPDRDGLWIGGEKIFDLYAYRYAL